MRPPAATRAFRFDGRVALVHERGSGPAAPVVLVHGIGVARLYFEPLAHLLAASGRVIVVELPGFGRAPKQRHHSPPSIEELARLLAALLRDAGGGPYRLVGHSMGTQIVADLAARDPQLVADLALLGPVTDPAAPDAVRQGLRLALDTLGESAGANAAVFTDYLRTGPLWYLRTLPFMLGYDLLGVLPRIPVPALVLRGARDPIAPHDWTAEVAAHLPRSRFVEVPGAHHVVQFTHAAAVAAALSEGVR
ncbi:MAG TPA: alpha/beta fold hydrolase [Amnibacterium sp.]|uniref:alpha/beta fold hydrolase n=1 Tax=Amnibacterium sp. TaxID=1872496 RepID=UPI002F94403C